jgi:hypothetical protein
MLIIVLIQLVCLLRASPNSRYRPSLDMLRTVVKVTGDASISTVVAKSEGKLNV